MFGLFIITLYLIVIKFKLGRFYMAEILPLWRKTLFIQSTNQTWKIIDSINLLLPI